MSEHVTDRLSEYLDDELEPGERRDVERHLQGCAECRATLDALRGVVSLGRTLQPKAPDTALWGAIRHEIESSGTGAAAAPQPRPRPLARAAALVAAALLGALGAFAWLTWLGARESAATPRTQEQPVAAADGPRWLLLLHGPDASQPRPSTGEDRATIIGRYAAWRREHALIGEKLADEAGRRLAGDAAPAALTGSDIGGMFIIQADDAAQAESIASTCPHIAYGGWIELHRIEDT